MTISIRSRAVVLALMMALPLHLQAAVIYVDVNATGTEDGSSWVNAYRHLQSALAAAVQSDEIWVAQGVYRPDYDPVTNQHTGDPAAYFDIATVSLYGGFDGTETDREQRNPALHRTTLCGDLAQNDGPDFANYEDNSTLLIGGWADGNVVDGFDIRAANGSGIQVRFGLLLTVRNCRFLHILGGTALGVEVYSSYAPQSWARVENCQFQSNRSKLIQTIKIAQVTLSGCTFSDNTSHQTAVELRSYPYNMHATVADCDFARNIVESGSVLRAWDLLGVTMTVEDCRFLENTVAAEALLFEGSSLDVRRSVFLANEGSGAMSTLCTESTTIENVHFIGNKGGALGANPTATVINCVFSGNTAKNAAAAGGRRLKMINCTVANNRNTEQGGAIDCMESIELTNSILWGNTTSWHADQNAQINYMWNASIEVNHSCIAGWTGELGGIGNTGAAPLLINATGADNIAGTLDDDLRLAAGSPCIDAGDNTAVPPETTLDLAGNPRIENGTVDMGALETHEQLPCVTKRFHVLQTAQGDQSGLDWQNACTDLHDALEMANQAGGSPVEIWVGAGRYKPDRNTGNPDRFFTLRGRASLYGGFAGSETSREQRDTLANETILTGDLADNDGPDGTGMEENSSLVVLAETWLSDDFVLDGVTITGAPPSSGLGDAGLSILGNPVIRNCRIERNMASGMEIWQSAPRIEHCQFTNNTGVAGAALVWSGSPIVSDCVFEENSASEGGAVELIGGSPMFFNCRFGNNTAERGGALSANDDFFSGDALHATLINCIFAGNVGTEAGGAVYISLPTDSTVNLSQCTFAHNTTAQGGGVIHHAYGSLTVANSILCDSDASYSVFLPLSGAILDIQHCVLPHGRAGVRISDGVLNYGPGMVEADPGFMDSLGSDGIAGTQDDDLRPAPGSPAIDAGNNSALPPDMFDLDGDGDSSEPWPHDFRGLARRVDDPTAEDVGMGDAPIVDIGAYEYQEDCNNNGVLDSVDLRDGTSADCNSNGIPDECDVATGTSADCNLDGIPDECQLEENDCNSNGIPDDCEPDEDNDGVIDDCDACPGTEPGTRVGPDGCPLPVPGDFDGDFDVDQEDFGQMQICFSGTGVPQPDPRCTPAKLDADHDVDTEDLAIFMGCFTGPGVRGDVGCAD